MPHSCPVKERCYAAGFDCYLHFRKNCLKYEQILQMMQYEDRKVQRRNQEQDRLDLETIKLQIERAGIW